jgi:hypothetical protein
VLNKVECCDVNNCHYDLSGDMFQRIYGSSGVLKGATRVAGVARVARRVAGVMEGGASVTGGFKPIKPRKKTTSVLHWIDQSAYLPNRTVRSLYSPAAVNSGDGSSGGSSGGSGSKGNSTGRLKKAGLMRYALAYVPSGCKVNRFKCYGGIHILKMV